ncbi:hypothetical protein HMI56_002998 [Coelomomyces lativittatus]|nr:hypothetical protein HMI56_002998 [Coelomomyces lativittatus]
MEYHSRYFLWDTLFSWVYVKYFGIPFLFHGVAAFCVFFFAYKPFLMYFGAAFLVFEASTPFLNLHWYLDKLGYSGTFAQYINGCVLVVVFFLCRLVCGMYFSIQFYDAITQVASQFSSFTYYGYVVANISLNCLNMYWWMAMVTSFRRRLRHHHRQARIQKMK